MRLPLVRTLYIFLTTARLMLSYLWLDFTANLRSEAGQAKAEERAFRRWGRLLRSACLRMGGVVIKGGQFLSTRADVLPPSFTSELSSLQDAVPPAPFRAVKRLIESEFGTSLATLFQSFEERPLASASLGQVHRAVLPEGQTVAVKVLRPGVEALVDSDIAALRMVVSFLGRVTSWGRRFDLNALADEFEATTRREMDYLQEADNIRRFRKLFLTRRDVDLPFPYDNLVTRRVLVMEFMEGLKLTDRAGLLAAGLDPRVLAQRLIDAYLQQTLVDGFVHVDPHPGNLLVRPDGTLIFLDFGMMTEITPDDRRHATALVMGLVSRDLDGAVQAIRDLGLLRPGADGELLKDALALLLNFLSGTPIRPGAELEHFLVEFRAWLYEEPLQFPARYLFLGRALGLLAGMAMTLDPGIDWVATLKAKALPMLGAARQDHRDGPQDGEPGEAEGTDKPGWRDLLKEFLGPTAFPAVKAALGQVQSRGAELLRLPGDISRVMAKAESGRLQVQVDVSPVQAAVDRVAWAVITAGGAITGALLRQSSPPEGLIAWGITAVVSLGMLVPAMARRRRRRVMAAHLSAASRTARQPKFH